MKSNNYFPIIDTHVHFIQYNRYRKYYNWIPKYYPNLQRNYLFNKYSEAVNKCIKDNIYVKKYILINTVNKENEFELVSDRFKILNPKLEGIVPYLTIESLERIATNKYFKGIRYILTPSNQEIFFSCKAYKLLELLIKKEKHLELLITPDQWELTLHFLNKIPLTWTNNIIVNHLGKPFFFGNLHEKWIDFIKEVTKTEVYIKISGGLLEWINPNNLNKSIFKAYETLFLVANVDKLIWGSDWPLVTRLYDYCTWLKFNINIIQTIIRGDYFKLLKIFYKNAIKFYKIKDDFSHN